jgi:hypothetical protein
MIPVGYLDLYLQGFPMTGYSPSHPTLSSKLVHLKPFDFNASNTSGSLSSFFVVHVSGQIAEGVYSELEHCHGYLSQVLEFQTCLLALHSDGQGSRIYCNRCKHILWYPGPECQAYDYNGCNRKDLFYLSQGLYSLQQNLCS